LTCRIFAEDGNDILRGCPDPRKTAASSRPKKPKRKSRVPYIYSPEGFRCEDHGLSPKDDHAVRWLLNSIYFNHIVGKYERDDYCPLNARLLAKVMGREVARVRTACVDAGLVDYMPHYKAGVESSKYRLGPKLASVQWRRWEGDGQVYINRYRTWKEDIVGVRLDDLGRYMRKWAKAVKIHKDGLEKTFAAMPDAKRDLARAQIGYLEQGVIRTKYCRFGRFHTNFTRLCGEIRKNHLAIDGEKLVEIDIVNSQCLFVANLLMRTGNYLRTCSLHSNVRNHHEHYRKHLANAYIPHLCQLVSRPIPSTSPYDLRISDPFVQSVIKGRVYEDFQDHFSLATRDHAKVEFFKTVYSGNVDRFRQVFPAAGRSLAKLVRKHRYKWVSRQMQWEESDVILRKAVDRLRREHPMIPVITVHDSILTTERYVAVVRRIMLEAFDGLPIKPILRLKEQNDADITLEVAPRSLCDDPDGIPW